MEIAPTIDFMLLLNFTHPITPAHQTAIETLAGQPITRTLAEMVQFDQATPFADQAAAVLDRLGLDSAAWQTTPILVNLPGYAPAAACLLAELHGRMGHFPAIVRLRPLEGSVPTSYQVAEIINLQAVRDHARKRR